MTAVKRRTEGPLHRFHHAGPDVPALWSTILYSAVGLGGSIGPALYLTYHRDRLG